MRIGPSLVALLSTAVLAAGDRVEHRARVVTATAYNATVAQTDSRPTEAAWGDRLKPGMKVIAVSGDLLDDGLGRGTKVRIDGLPGTWTVMDRMASRHANRIDLFMGYDVRAARHWGLREVTIRWIDAPTRP